MEPINVSAVSEGGLCVYSNSLLELSTDREALGRVYVIPGRIERDQKPFYRVEDISQDYRPNKGSIENVLSFKDLQRPQLAIKESVRTICAAYSINLTTDDGPCNLCIGPAQFDRFATTLSRRVACRQYSCAKVWLGSITKERLQHISVQSRNIILYRGDKLACCASLNIISRGWSQRAPGVVLVLQQDSCLQCCLRASLRTNIRGKENGPIVIISEA